MKATNSILIAAAILLPLSAASADEALQGRFQFKNREAVRVSQAGEAIAREFQVKVFIEPSIRQVELLASGDHELSYDELKALLRRRSIEPVWSKAGEKWTLGLFSRRNLSGQVGVCDIVCTKEEQLPKRNTMATYIHKVRHGEGRDIFMTLRSLQARDRTRAGNIMWRRSPDTLVITDLTDHLRPLLAVLNQLDREPPMSRARVVVFNLLPEDARALKLDQKLYAAEDKAALIKSLRADKRVHVGLDAEVTIASDAATDFGRVAVSLTRKGRSWMIDNGEVTTRMRLKKGRCELLIRANPDARSNMVTCVFATPLSFKNRD